MFWVREICDPRASEIYGCQNRYSFHRAHHDSRGLTYKAAERQYRRALAIKDKVLGAGSPDAALTRNNLGKLLTDVGRPGEAVQLLKAAVSTLEDRLAPGLAHLTKARKNLRKAMQSLAETRAPKRAEQ